MAIFFFLMSSLLLFPMESQMKGDTISNLAKIRQAKILFGHQSVGANILQGVQELAANAGAEGPRIAPWQELVAAPGTFLADARIGQNGDPASKCAEFLQVAQSFSNGGLDVALMKFCYADFTPQTNVAELFQLYRRSVDSLRQAFPRLVIVHCTAPLTARTPWWKRFLKWVLRREDFSDGGNILRNEYNELVRRHYNSEPILDIAHSESTLPNGMRSSFSFEGQEIYTLAADYTDDGGHLNSLGRKVVAEKFVEVIAQALAMKNERARAHGK
jgi:hypothetical protein